MNLDQKVDAILAAVSTPPVVTVDSAAIVTAVAAALATQLAAIQTSLTDIQGQVEEPVVPAAAVGSAAGAAS